MDTGFQTVGWLMGLEKQTQALDFIGKFSGRRRIVPPPVPLSSFCWEETSNRRHSASIKAGSQCLAPLRRDPTVQISRPTVGG